MVEPHDFARFFNVWVCLGNCALVRMLSAPLHLRGVRSPTDLRLFAAQEALARIGAHKLGARFTAHVEALDTLIGAKRSNAFRILKLENAPCASGCNRTGHVHSSSQYSATSRHTTFFDGNEAPAK